MIVAGRRHFLGLFTLAAPLLVGGCVIAPGENGGSLFDLGGERTVTYRCDGDRELQVTFNSDRDRALVEAGDRTYRLRLEDRDGRQRQYGEGDVELFIERDEARLRLADASDYSDCEER